MLLTFPFFKVNWGSEAGCFETFLRELAYFYVPGPLNVTKATDKGDKAQSTEEKAERWQIQHILFPTIRRYLMAPKSLLERDVVQVASLPDLYRVFERC
jgi:DNA mismatch repair protein MLH1